MLTSLAFGIAFLLAFHFLAQRKATYKSAFGGVTLLLAFTVGIATAVFHQETLHSNHYLNQIQEDVPYEIDLTVHEKLKNTAKNSRYVSVINAIGANKSLGKVILNIKLPNQMEDLPIGSRLKIYTNIYKNKNPFNPNQFDYGKYLENQQIYGQVYVGEKQIVFGEAEVTLWSRFSNFRTRIIETLELSHFKKEERARTAPAKRS